MVPQLPSADYKLSLLGSISIKAEVFRKQSFFNMSGPAYNPGTIGCNLILHNCQAEGRSREEDEGDDNFFSGNFVLKSEIKVFSTLKNNLMQQSCDWLMRGDVNLKQTSPPGRHAAFPATQTACIQSAPLWLGFIFRCLCVVHSLSSLPAAARCSRVSDPCGWSSSCGGTSELKLRGVWGGQ